MLEVKGNVTENEIPKLKDLLQKSYEYTVEEIAKDARKLGMKV